jgi:hypothetical protein
MAENVFLVTQQYKARWGGPDLVFAQLASYFELMDRCTFEYALNLSAYDVPLMDVDMIYEWLVKSGPQTNFLRFMSTNHYEHSYFRLRRAPTFQTKDFKDLFAENAAGIPDMELDVYRGYAYSTTHQWHVLTYGFLQTLRTDAAAATHLIQYEWSYLVDEVFFNAWAYWNKRIVPTIKNYQTRCIVFQGSHPVDLDRDMLDTLWQCVRRQRLFARKWKMDKDGYMMKHFEKMRAYHRRRAMKASQNEE